MTQEDLSSFNKNFWRFLWSAIIIALSGCLGNIIDAAIVGNLIGEDGVSAINLSKTIVQFMFTVSMLLSTGAGMLVGMELGKRQEHRAAYIYSMSIMACLAFGLFMTLCGIVCPDSITHMICSNRMLFDSTRDYLQPMLLGAPAFMLVWALGTMIAVDGSPRLVSIAILIDNIVNLTCDIVFIKLLGWGITGSSVATVVGHIIGIAIMFRHFLYPNNHLRPIFHDTTSAWGSIISQGAPLAVASICLTLLMFCSNRIILSTGGRIAIFAYSVCMNLLQIYNLFLAGTCRTVQSLGAIEVGKGDNEAFQLVIRKSFRFITWAMIGTCLLVWIFPQAVAKFFGASEPDIINQTAHALRVFAISFIPFCYIYTLMIVYKLYAHHKMALFISFALSLTVIPVLWLVARYAPQYMWYSFLIAYIIEGVAIFIIHKIGHIKFILETK